MARQLARLVSIDALSPIDGADAIEVAHVGGWRVVVKKQEFAPGDLAIYFEIDAFLPEGNPAWQFLVDKSPRVFEARRGHVLRSVKLRGQVSQGLLLGVAALAGTPLAGATLAAGLDVAEALGVSKYDPPLPASLSGVALGPFPSRVPKTDQERIQNLAPELAAWQQAGGAWEVSEKLEGTSVTFAWLDGTLHVCSRNLDLADTPGNSLWEAARELGLPQRMGAAFGTRNVALQGELVGPGVQGNLYGLARRRFHLFDIYDADAERHLGSAERQALAEQLGLPHVPLVEASFLLSPATGIETLLALADGPSALKPSQRREGLVFKSLDQAASFKVISNQYLLKQKD
jgi:RNA ligase (TIGR02306 family)